MATKFDRLCDAVIAEYQAHSGDATLGWERGQKRLSEHSAPTRVVIVRDGGVVQPATRLGPQIVDGEATRPIKSRVENITFHIFTGAGADEDADNERAEAILEELVAALDTVCGSALVGELEYAWWHETEAGAAWETYGCKVVLVAKVRMGVVRGRHALVVPESFGLTASIGLGAFSSGFTTGFSRAGGEAA